MIQPTEKQTAVACAAARKAIEAYSVFYSSQISDDLVRKIIQPALVAALNVTAQIPVRPTLVPTKPKDEPQPWLKSIISKLRS